MLIVLEQITKAYQMGQSVVQALNDVSLTIDKGEFVAIWGPSGSGKTTILNLISAIDRPTSGKIIIDGHDLGSLNDNVRSDLRSKTIGFIFQNFNLIPVLTALENVMLPLEIQKIKRSATKEKAEMRIEEVGIVDFMHHRPDQLSGGQKQRVAIARALVTDPSLVIADEPTANLDTDTALNTLELMRTLNERNGITFVFSTHDQRLLNRVKRLIHLQDGQIIEDKNTTDKERSANGVV